MKKRLIVIAAMLAVTVSLTACGKKEASNEPHTHRTASGDLQETTSSLKNPPAFLNNQVKQIGLVYQLAAQNTDLLQWIPCYCGCGESAGHRSNLNCFIKEVKTDGSVVWDDHGTRCGTCMEIAVISAKLKQEGKSAKEIRAMIEQTYKQGYAKPTNTPMPI